MTVGRDNLTPEHCMKSASNFFSQNKSINVQIEILENMMKFLNGYWKMYFNKYD